MKSAIFSFLLLITLSFTVSILQAQEKPVPEAKEILEMKPDDAFASIQKLSKSQAEVLISQIRVEARKEYKNIDKFYILISHLESIRAIEEEEKRLRDLNMVYMLGLSLMTGVIGYTLFSQRKSIDSIKEHIH
ncbi:MAG: hypothetical protein H7A24_11445 [Leptospiraceae bacterium]|nr:hypothetical protein [Leptospiraceae bacterium]MCP5512488.1 hypothetical protein [Leptospiraceae bacterium]